MEPSKRKSPRLDKCGRQHQVSAQRAKYFSCACKSRGNDTDLVFSVPKDFLGVFEAVTEDQSLIDFDNRGDIAIDDVIVTPNLSGCCEKICHKIDFAKSCRNNFFCLLFSISRMLCSALSKWRNLFRRTEWFQVS